MIIQTMEQSNKESKEIDNFLCLYDKDIVLINNNNLKYLDQLLNLIQNNFLEKMEDKIIKLDNITLNNDILEKINQIILKSNIRCVHLYECIFGEQTINSSGTIIIFSRCKYSKIPIGLSACEQLEIYHNNFLNVLREKLEIVKIQKYDLNHFNNKFPEFLYKYKDKTIIFENCELNGEIDLKCLTKITLKDCIFKKTTVNADECKILNIEHTFDRYTSNRDSHTINQFYCSIFPYIKAKNLETICIKGYIFKNINNFPSYKEIKLQNCELQNIIISSNCQKTSIQSCILPNEINVSNCHTLELLNSFNDKIINAPQIVSHVDSHYNNDYNNISQKINPQKLKNIKVDKYKFDIDSFTKLLKLNDCLLELNGCTFSDKVKQEYPSTKKKDNTLKFRVIVK